jgi:hypothetical protein
MGATRVRPSHDEVGEIIKLMVSLPSFVPGALEGIEMPTSWQAHLKLRRVARDLAQDETTPETARAQLRAFLRKYRNNDTRRDVRLSTALNERIAAAAEAAGLDVSEWLRVAAVEKLERGAA